MKKNINIYIDEIKIGEIYSEYSDLLIVVTIFIFSI